MESTNLNRRLFLRGKPPKVESNAIRPPWSIEASQFVEQCERCDKCIEVCPEKILFRGEGGYPEVDFKRGECTFCTECADACEANVFHYIKSKKSHQPSPAIDNAWHLNVSIKPNCLSINAIVCRACGDNCGEQAIHFQLQVGGISIPEISEDKCTGCGACLSVCPELAVSIQNRL